ncbi:MAG: hypothetical protein MRJ93_12070 [Nitrososphaeraceae archaeon]|nr:hypothetical protein [Nitrososphaeraceae archaeon]
MENKINETLDRETGYLDMVLELQSGTLNPKYKRFVPPVTVKFLMQTP